MALIFEYCISCGGKTQIDTTVRPARRRCTLCGGPCSDAGVKDAVLQPEWMRTTEAAGEEEETHVPVELVHANCPRCKADIAIDPDKSLTKQRCHVCGMLLADKRRKRKLRKDSGFTADGVLVRRSRERVWMPMAGAVLVVVPALIFAIWMAWRKEPMAVLSENLPPAPRVQIRELVTKFTAAKTPEELLPLIRDPDKFEKPLRAWCAAHPGALPPGGDLLQIQFPRPVLGTNVSEVAVAIKDFPAGFLLAVETPAGYRLEWPAFSGIGEMSVPEFLAQKPAMPVLLLTISHRSDYYNHAYADSTAWQCLRVRDSAGGNPFFAYVPRQNEALMAAIAHLPEVITRRSLNVSDVSRPVALRLHFPNPEPSGAPQAEVASVAGDRWYVP